MRSAAPHSGPAPRDPQRAARPIIVVLGILFVLIAAVDLAGVRPLTGDEAIILLVSEHLAEHGELGSPLHRGYHGAGEHYFLNLPLAHVLHAAVFRVAGAGIAQARAVSVAGALLLFASTTLLAWRRAGPRAAIISALLLVLWRSGLAGLVPGIPLIGSARTARYDVLAAGFAWLALLLFDAQVRRPRARTAIATGVAAAAACLTQFHGAFVAPALVAGWILWHPRDGTRGRHGALAATAAVALLLPYALHFAAHASDAIAQLRGVHGARMDAAPSILWNLVAEPRRWLSALSWRRPGSLLLVAGIIPVLVVLAVQARRGAGVGVGLLLLATAAFWLPLALLDQTKAPLYALPLLPAICVAFAIVLDHMLGARDAWGSMLRGFALVLMLGVSIEGAAAIVRDLKRMPGVTPYADIVTAIDSAIPQDAGVTGAARFAWGLRAHPYAELRALSLSTRTQPLRDALGAHGVRYVLVDADVRAALERPDFYGAAFVNAWNDLIERCTTLVGELDDATWQRIEIRAILTGCMDR
jgi:4-amino-4-deoxy-L-arabinose transferase-like glycosyltransferase